MCLNNSSCTLALQLEGIESVLEPRITFLDRFGINLRFKYGIQTPAGQPQVCYTLPLHPSLMSRRKTCKLLHV
jgi:hypothetical protein